MIENLKHIIIIYNPGYAGNFLTRVFSLGDEVVTHFPKQTLLSNIVNMDKKISLYSFSQVNNNYLNWQKFHRAWPDFYDYELFKLKFKETNCTHIVFSMHEPEFNKHLIKLQSIKNIEFLFVDLNLEKYENWINKSKQYLNFKYRLDEELNYFELSKKITNKINLSKIIESEEGFLSEYQRICSIVGIQEYIPEATILYKDWYSVRVQGKI